MGWFESPVVAPPPPPTLLSRTLSMELVVVFLMGLCTGLLLPYIYHVLFHRYATVKDIPESSFDNEVSLRGTVVAVSDGDTFRLRHMPWLTGVGSYDGKKLTENTLQIRLAGIDTPEIAHFGKPCQPYAKEAKAQLTSMLQGRIVTVRLLRRDQYGRAVCMVTYGTWPFSYQNVSEELLKFGLARVYRLGGAAYGGLLDTFNALEAEAQAARLHIWSD
ncbi:Aste57867_798 [Aphanomyces stellatus]|uniref:Aste57867_798 protein n=1 Tax=Aphanomyces stellatus TaxID=120398 RepID=A0A485K3I1_9STRA|nr:hypothetical protein As57867_000797 [Aphanomyces stellatus]VFT78022.1 Aste57867_798 [Aphanomyces stellatus]